MGCSSVKLANEGEFDDHGMVHGYLMGGCSMVVGNLWDVTDKDIDRFCLGVVKRMTSGGRKRSEITEDDKEEEEGKKKRGRKKKGKSGKRKKKVVVEEEEMVVVDVLRSISSARDDCKMKYMIGAAPVVYGVPVVVSCTRMR